MEHKIFLGKYRVAPAEMALAAVEPATVSVTATATEEVTTARIYHGDEIDSGRDVTIEAIPVGTFKPSVRAKLEEEAAAAKQINHINIPALYDFGFEDDHLIYVTEYFEGTSAEEWVNAHGPMPTGAVLRIAIQVMGAMGAAAFHKISHHAINPANLVLVPGQTPEGDWPLIKVLHFIGVAPTFTGGDMSVAAFDKSTHYASPEQLQGGTVDFRSEIYSLGATLWFLLTGAPPLVAPKGPLALQPATSGAAADRLNGMPKRVRRLLAQMLSVDPEARPQDPLAVYRHLQECVVQVERRESMAKRFGVPFLSGPKIAALPSRRPFPTKLVALAAIVIALATLASIGVASYLRHQRVRQAEEPIGVPIGVAETNASAAPVIANAPTVVPAPPQPETAAPPTTTTSENQPPATKTESAPVVAANQPPPAPVQPEASAPSASNPPAEKSASEAPRIAANEPKAVEEKSEPPPPQPKETAPTEVQEAPKVAANEPQVVEEKSEPRAPKESVRTQAREKPRRKIEAVAARPASPEVRRAEPAPPGEGFEEVAQAPETKPMASTTTKKDRAEKSTRDATEEETPRAEPANGDEEVAAAPPALSQLPRGRTRAKFIGVTADGNWMFSLPSKKIVIVPPPPGG